MSDWWQIDQASPMSNDGGCLVQFLKFAAGFVIMGAMVFYLPRENIRQSQKPKPNIESTTQDLTESNARFKQAYADTLAVLEQMRSDSIARVK